MACAACRVLLEHLGFADTLEPLPAGPTPEASLDAAAASLAGTSLDNGGQPGADQGAGEAAEGLESRDDADFFDQHQGVLGIGNHLRACCAAPECPDIRPQLQSLQSRHAYC